MKINSVKERLQNIFQKLDGILFQSVSSISLNKSLKMTEEIMPNHESTFAEKLIYGLVKLNSYSAQWSKLGQIDIA